IEHVIQLASELKCHLDLRWIEHSYGHYLTQLASGGWVDWRGMVKFHKIKTLTYFDHTPPAKLVQTDQNGAEKGADLLREVAIAQELAQTSGLSRDERLRIWEERTGLSRPTYYRRLQAGK